MSRRKAGLHKNISSIFDGVPVQKTDGTGSQDGASPKQAQKSTFSRLPALERQEPKPPAPKEPEQKPVQPSPARASGAQSRPAAKARGPKPWQKTFEKIRNSLVASKGGISQAKQKKMVILVPILALAFIFVLTRALSTPQTDNAAKSAGFGPSAAVAAATAPADEEANWQIPAVYPEMLRDPMQFGSQTSQAHSGNLTVRGIVYSEDNPSAVVGTEIVRIGDEIAGAKVVKINPDSVEFESEDKRWTQQVQR